MLPIHLRDVVSCEDSLQCLNRIFKVTIRLCSLFYPSIIFRYAAPIKVDVEYIEGSHGQKNRVIKVQ